ncbi:hypothetical protein B0H14DRAFT_2606871 [Mycena olivaceomarginata]|nr:hypothetical protein B0H14DRAFT_2606871 [Mycena olivaceomarginata]
MYAFRGLGSTRSLPQPEGLTDPLRRLALRVPISRADEHYRFFGKSSTVNFIKEALEYAEPTDPSKAATCVTDDTSGVNFAFQSVSLLTSSEIVATAGPSTVIESQTPISAQPSQKRRNLGPLKAWGVQHDRASLITVDYAQNYEDKFNEEYPEHAKAVLPADSDEYIMVGILGFFRLTARSYVPHSLP